MNKDFKLDLENDFTEEEMAAIQPPEINLHSKEEQIIDLYTNSDKTVADIVAELNVSTRTIYEVLAAKRIKLKNAKASVQARVARIPATDKETAIDLYKNTKASVKDLMAALDVNKRTFYAILDEAGVPRRNNKEVESNNEKKPAIIRIHREGNELMILLTKHGQESVKKVSVSYEV
jgi:transposase-like protein